MPLPLSQPVAPIGLKRHTQVWTMLGLVVGLLSLITLLELFPRLSVSGEPPLDRNNQLGSSRFTVTNDGYIPLTDVMSACFLWKVEEGNVGYYRSLAFIVKPPESKLDADESFTVPCAPNLAGRAGQPLAITQADLAMVVYYRPWPFTFLRRHKLLRLVARIGEQGDIIWERQPAAPLEKDFDAYIQAHGGTFPPQPPSFK
jgi:hypothetical protein